MTLFLGSYNIIFIQLGKIGIVIFTSEKGKTRVGKSKPLTQASLLARGETRIEKGENQISKMAFFPCVSPTLPHTTLSRISSHDCHLFLHTLEQMGRPEDLSLGWHWFIQSFSPSFVSVQKFEFGAMEDKNKG